MSKSLSRLRLSVSTRGKHVQWVISGVQVAAWSRVTEAEPRSLFHIAPLARKHA